MTVYNLTKFAWKFDERITDSYDIVVHVLNGSSLGRSGAINLGSWSLRPRPKSKEVLGGSWRWSAMARPNTWISAFFVCVCVCVCVCTCMYIYLSFIPGMLFKNLGYTISPSLKSSLPYSLIKLGVSLEDKATYMHFEQMRSLYHCNCSHHLFQWVLWQSISVKIGQQMF